MRFLTRDAARAVDEVAIRDYHLPGLVLMENAGRGTADWLRELGVTSPVVICCGKGNNGGDGFVVARHLELHGLEVEVVVCCDPALLSGDARVNYDVLVAAEMPMWILGVDGTVADLAAQVPGLVAGHPDPCGVLLRGLVHRSIGLLPSDVPQLARPKRQFHAQ